MLPKVIVYNFVSIDGAIKGFDVDIALHYEVLGSIGADALLAGSITAKSGVELFTKVVPPEEPADFKKQAILDNDSRPIWVIVDSKGALSGVLHVLRKSEYAKDIVVLVSKKTPSRYLYYLKDRNYEFVIAGEDHVDYRLALEELNKRFGIHTLVTDSGGVLASVLLEQELVDEVHLLITSEVVGKNAQNLFRTLNKPTKFQLIEAKNINQTHALLKFKKETT